jgi:hypothetical protein
MKPAPSKPGAYPLLPADAPPHAHTDKGSVSSLLMSSALHRLGGALGLVLLLWLAVGWALAGST